MCREAKHLCQLSHSPKGQIQTQTRLLSLQPLLLEKALSLPVLLPAPRQPTCRCALHTDQPCPPLLLPPRAGWAAVRSLPCGLSAPILSCFQQLLPDSLLHSPAQVKPLSPSKLSCWVPDRGLLLPRYIQNLPALTETLVPCPGPEMAISLSLLPMKTFQPYDLLHWLFFSLLWPPCTFAHPLCWCHVLDDIWWALLSSCFLSGSSLDTRIVAL